MKRLLLACLTLGLFVGHAAVPISPEVQSDRVAKLIQQADELNNRGQGRQALAKFFEAREILQQLRKDHPDYRKRPLVLQAEELQRKIRPLEVAYPSTRPSITTFEGTNIVVTAQDVKPRNLNPSVLPNADGIDKLAKLESQIKQLQARNETLENDLLRLKTSEADKIKTVQQRLTEQDRLLTQQKTEIDRLAREKDIAKSEKKNTEVNLQLSLDAANQKLILENQKLSQLSREKQELLTQLADLKQSNVELGKVEKERTELQRKVSELTIKVAGLEKEAAKPKSDPAALAEARREAIAANQKAAAEIQKAAELEKKSNELSIRLTKLEADAAKPKADPAELRQLNQALADSRKKSADDATRMKNLEIEMVSLMELVKENEGFENLAAVESKKRKELEAEVKTLQAKVKDSDRSAASLAELDKERTELKKKVSDLNTQLAKIQGELDLNTTAAVALPQVRESLELTQTTLAAEKKRAADLAAQNESLASQLQIAERNSAQVKELQADLEAARKSAAAELRKRETIETKLARQPSGDVKELKLLNEALELSRKRTADDTVRLQRLEASLGKLEEEARSAREAKAQAALLEKEKEDLARRNGELAKQVTKLEGASSSAAADSARLKELQTALNQAKETATSEARKRQELEKETQLLVAKSKEAEQTTASLKSLEKERSDLQKRVADVSNQLAKAQTQLASKPAAPVVSNELKEALELARNNLTAEQKKAAALSTQNEELALKLRNADRGLQQAKALEKEKEDLARRNSELAKQVTKLEGASSSAAADSARLKELQTALNQAKETATSEARKRQELEKETQLLVAKSKEAEQTAASLRSLEKERSDLQKRVADVSNQLAKAQTQLASKPAAPVVSNELKEALELARNNLTAEQKKAAALSTQNEELALKLRNAEGTAAQTKALEQEKEQLAKRNLELTQQVSEYEAGRTRLQTALEEARESALAELLKRQLAETALSEQPKTDAREMSQLNEAIAQARKRTAEDAVRMKNLESTLVTLQGAAKEAEESRIQLDVVSREKLAVSQKLTEASGRIAGLEAEVAKVAADTKVHAQLQSSLADARNEVATLRRRALMLEEENKALASRPALDPTSAAQIAALQRERDALKAQISAGAATVGTTSAATPVSTVIARNDPLQIRQLKDELFEAREKAAAESRRVKIYEQEVQLLQEKVQTLATAALRGNNTRSYPIRNHSNQLTGPGQQRNFGGTRSTGELPGTPPSIQEETNPKDAELRRQLDDAMEREEPE